ncbi:MAG TPA: hypothetical protein PKB14_25585 [Rubrivivax sp.]|nr:hypothetical protein [Rubrivivax sp.]
MGKKARLILRTRLWERWAAEHRAKEAHVDAVIRDKPAALGYAV